MPASCFTILALENIAVSPCRALGTFFDGAIFLSITGAILSFKVVSNSDRGWYSNEMEQAGTQNEVGVTQTILTQWTGEKRVKLADDVWKDFRVT